MTMVTFCRNVIAGETRMFRAHKFYGTQTPEPGERICGYVNGIA